MNPEPNPSAANIIGFIADIQTEFSRSFREVAAAQGWKAADARLQVFHSCGTAAAHARFSVGLVAFARANGLKERDWWDNWTLYDSDQAFLDWPKFETFVDDVSRQFVHHVQDELLFSVQIYVEAFLRNLGRQFQMDRPEFWKLKRDFLEGRLGLAAADLAALSVYQHLRNSLHNKGLHHNPNYPNLAWTIDGWEFNFSLGKVVQISWEHVRALQIGTAKIVRRIAEHPDIVGLPPLPEGNLVVIVDKDG